MTLPAKKCRVVCPGPDAELKRAKKVAEALKEFIALKPNASASKYPRIEDWIFVGNCYGHDARVVATQEIKRVVPIHRDGQSQPEVPWEYVAEAELVNRDGRVVGHASAACSRDEAKWNQSPAFQLRSMAQTRAEAKAFSMKFRWVTVLAGLEGTPAEEMDSTENQEPIPIDTCTDCKEGVFNYVELKTAKLQFEVPLCEPCRLKRKEAGIMAPFNDPQFIEKSVAHVNEVRDRTIRGVSL